MSLSSGGGYKKRGAGERQIPPGSTSFQAQGNRPIIFPCEGTGDREGRDSRADRHRLIKTLLYLKSDKREMESERNARNRCFAFFITIRNHADRVAIMVGYPERVTRSARALFNEKPTGCPHQTHPLTLFSSAL